MCEIHAKQTCEAPAKLSDGHKKGGLGKKMVCQKTGNPKFEGPGEPGGVLCSIFQNQVYNIFRNYYLTYLNMTILKEEEEEVGVMEGGMEKKKDPFKSLRFFHQHGGTGDVENKAEVNFTRSRIHDLDDDLETVLKAMYEGSDSKMKRKMKNIAWQKLMRLENFKHHVSKTHEQSFSHLIIDASDAYLLWQAKHMSDFAGADSAELKYFKELRDAQMSYWANLQDPEPEFARSYLYFLGRMMKPRRNFVWYAHHSKDEFHCEPMEQAKKWTQAELDMTLEGYPSEKYPSKKCEGTKEPKKPTVYAAYKEYENRELIDDFGEKYPYAHGYKLEE